MTSKPGKLSTRSTKTDAALLEAVLAAPDSDEPRLVYADFLQERSDPRGEFITVQCSLAKLAETDKRRKPLLAREAELLKKHKKAWSASAPIGTFGFRRGFPELWKLKPRDLPKHAAAVFAREPIRVLDLSHGNLLDPPDPGYMNAFKCPELARIRRLELRRLRLTVVEVRVFAACKYLTNLRELDLAYMPMSRGAVEALTETPAFTQLEELSLRATHCDHRVVKSLANAPYAATLRSLNFCHSTIGTAGVITLANTKQLAGLTRLDVSDAKLNDAAAEALTASSVLANLEYLNVADNKFSPAVRKRLVVRYGKRLE